MHRDQYLLCSDGLPAMVPDPDIGLTLEIFSDSLQTVAKQLIKLANNNGDHDNISVVVARRSAEPEPLGTRSWGSAEPVVFVKKYMARGVQIANGGR